jgi:hypothetical protein
LPAAQPAHWIVHPVVAGRSENRQQSQFLFLFLEPPRKETTLRLLPSQGKRLLIRSTGLRKPPPPATEICTGGVREGIIAEFFARQKVIDETKSMLRTFVHGDGNCTVEFHDRKWLNPNQSVVK